MQPVTSMHSGCVSGLAQAVSRWCLRAGMQPCGVRRCPWRPHRLWAQMLRHPAPRALRNGMYRHNPHCTGLASRLPERGLLEESLSSAGLGRQLSRWVLGSLDEGRGKNAEVAMHTPEGARHTGEASSDGAGGRAGAPHTSATQPERGNPVLCMLCGPPSRCRSHIVWVSQARKGFSWLDPTQHQ